MSQVSSGLCFCSLHSYLSHWRPCPNVCDYAVSKCAGVGAKKDWVWPDHSNDHPLPQGHNHPLVSENLVSSFLGMPPGLETSESDSADIDVQTEFERRGGYLFTEIFPDHEHCADGCCVGHKLPELSRKFLAKLKYPKDLACFILEARHWFDQIDDDRSGRLSIKELTAEFEKIGLPRK